MILLEKWKIKRESKEKKTMSGCWLLAEHREHGWNQQQPEQPEQQQQQHNKTRKCVVKA